MALTHVLTPIRIAGCEIANRVVRTAHATRIGAGFMNDDLIAYHAVRARGGVGLSILEILSVHPTSPAPLNMFDPSLDEGYEKLMKAVSPYGMAVFQQVWHGGHNGQPIDGGPPWAPSAIPNPLGNTVPIPMTKMMIDEIIEAFVNASVRCEAAGLNGVEIHGAHGYLLQQFLSENFNKRTDQYGGSFENRARLAMEVMRAVKAACGPDFAVGIRLAPDMTAGGVGVEDNVRLAGMLEAEHLVDFVNISMGNYHSFPKMIGGMHEPVGYELPTSEQITKSIRVPTIVTGRFRTLEEADQVIRQGGADMVGMTRAHIADPDIIAKTKAGRPEEVRPCIACNQGCVGGLFADRMGCAVNPAVGRETNLDEGAIVSVGTEKRVVIIGGGVGGMEAARVAALRGHEVILFEATNELGGSLRYAAKLPKRHGIADIASWLESEIYRLGVDVRLSNYAEAAEVLAEKPDKVIVATGSMPRMDGVQYSNPGEPIAGVDQPHVYSSLDIISERRNWSGSSAIVLDNTGHYEAIGVAEHLVEGGASVLFVTPFISFGPKVESALMTEPALERMDKARGRFSMLCRHRLLGIGKHTVTLAPTYEGAPVEMAADTVVLVTPNEPMTDLAAELEAENVRDVVLVGDAKSPRTLQNAIYEGHLAGRGA